MAPTIEVQVPDLDPPPKAYEIVIKPLYVYPLKDGKDGAKVYQSGHGGGDYQGAHGEGDNDHGEGNYQNGYDDGEDGAHGEGDNDHGEGNHQNGYGDGEDGTSRSMGGGGRAHPATDDPLDRGIIGDYLKKLEGQIQRTGLFQYREFQGRPLAQIFKSLGLPMPHPNYMPSRCTGNKKALCIGINYTGQKNELKGCANDAHHIRKFLMQNCRFRSSQIMLLTDDAGDSRLHPTRQNMIAGMRWLVEGAKAHDSLFIHYSGHGGQKRAQNDQEADGLDEDIFPLDFKKSGDIIDNDLNRMLVQPLPPGCRLTAIFDCCHSGTVLDLPYLHSSHGRIKKTHISNRARRRQPPPADIICFSGCKDDETSADTFEGGIYVGAMSYAMIKTLTTNFNQSYSQVLESVRAILRPKYKQKPQLSASNPVDLEAKFVL